MITTYQYSKAHNRTQKVKDGVTSDYSYNNLNQLTRFTEPGRQVYFYYDDNGNRIRRTENGVVDTYAYDYENRLVSLQQGDVPYAYTYDYRTRRVERVEGDTRTKIVFSGGTSVQEYEAVPCEEGGAGGQESGSSGGQGCEELKVEYIRGSDYGGGIGGVLYTLREGDPSYTHYNNRGDVVAKTDDEQAVTYQATYEAFGTRTHEVGETQDRQKANTKDEDPTGLLNEGFRYRDLEAGSFITRDPLGHAQGPNLYAYVHQNPWTKFDPEGLLQMDRNGQVIMRPVDVPVTLSVGNGNGNEVSWQAQPVEMKTNDGRIVEGYKNLDPSSPNLNADCHGYTFGKGAVWIDNGQVKTILQGDGYQKTQKPKPGDVAIYSDKNGIVHSAVVASVDPKTGKVTVTDKRGTDPQIHKGPANKAWPGATISYYTQGEKKPGDKSGPSAPSSTGQGSGGGSTTQPSAGQPTLPGSGPASGSPKSTPPPPPAPSASKAAPAAAQPPPKPQPTPS